MKTAKREVFVGCVSNVPSVTDARTDSVRRGRKCDTKEAALTAARAMIAADEVEVTYAESLRLRGAVGIAML